MAQVDGIRRLAMISLHTSPLDQPGTGDAGGMNVYVVELARRLAAARHRGRHLHPRHQLAARRRSSGRPTASQVRHIHAGPFEGLTKDELPGQLCVFAREVLRAEAAQPVGHYDVVHSHYWLSGQVGALARDRWGVPLVHTMHTMAKVKNDALAEGDTPEPVGAGDRRGAGGRGRRRADRQHRPRGQAADQPVRRRARPGRGRPPRRRPRRLPAAGPGRGPRRLGLPGDAPCCCSPAGSSRSRRPTCCCAPSRSCSTADPSCARRLVVPVVGGPSGSGLDQPERSPSWPPSSGIDDVVRFVPPVAQDELAGWYAAATAGRRAVLQRVLRPGRRRGAGVRHPGGRRRGRRPDHRRPRRPQRAAGRRPRPARLGRRPRADRRRRRLRARSRPARSRRPGVLLGRHRRRTLEVYERARALMRELA